MTKHKEQDTKNQSKPEERNRSLKLEQKTKEQYQKLPEMSKNDYYNHNHFLINNPPNYDWGQQLLCVNYVSRPLG